MLRDVAIKVTSHPHHLSHVRSALRNIYRLKEPSVGKLTPFKTHARMHASMRTHACKHARTHAYIPLAPEEKQANSNPSPVPAPCRQASLASISNKLSCLAGDPLQADKFLLKCRCLVQGYYFSAQVPSCYCKTSKRLIETNDYNNSTLSLQAKHHHSFNY